MDQPDEFFSVGSPLEIVRLLQLAQTRQSLLMMRVPGRPVSALTTVLYLDSATNTLVLDAAQDPDLNRQIIAGGRVLFETTIDHIALAFETPGVALVDYENRPALHSHLPNAASYAQRRDTFRIDVPVSQPAICELWPGHDYSRAPVRLAVRDISATGMALADTALALDTAPGTPYRARLSLPGIGVFQLSLHVVHYFDDKLAKGGVARRVGCAFDSLDGSTGIRIQSYVNSLQRDQLSRRRARA